MGIGLHINLEKVEHRIILHISGRIDAASAPILERKLNTLIDEHHHRLILDFTRVDYLSSAGLRVLLSVTKKLETQKGGLILFAVTEDVGEIIKMAGFDKILRICATEKDALQ